MDMKRKKRELQELSLQHLQTKIMRNIYSTWMIKVIAIYFFKYGIKMDQQLFVETNS